MAGAWERLCAGGRACLRCGEAQACGTSPLGLHKDAHTHTAHTPSLFPHPLPSSLLAGPCGPLLNGFPLVELFVLQPPLPPTPPIFLSCSRAPAAHARVLCAAQAAAALAAKRRDDGLVSGDDSSSEDEALLAARKRAEEVRVAGVASKVWFCPPPLS